MKKLLLLILFLALAVALSMWRYHRWPKPGREINPQIQKSAAGPASVPPRRIFIIRADLVETLTGQFVAARRGL